jgi:hypothetical protein
MPDYDQMIDDCYQQIINHIEMNYSDYMHMIITSVDYVPYGSTSVVMESAEITDECLVHAAQDMWEAELINYKNGRYTIN